MWERSSTGSLSHLFFFLGGWEGGGSNGVNMRIGMKGCYLRSTHFLDFGRLGEKDI